MSTLRLLPSLDIFSILLSILILVDFWGVVHLISVISLSSMSLELAFAVYYQDQAEPSQWIQQWSAQAGDWKVAAMGHSDPGQAAATPTPDPPQQVNFSSYHAFLQISTSACEYENCTNSARS